MWIIAVMIITILIVIILYLDTKKIKNFPPGPSWLPILGCALQVDKYRKKMGTLCMGTTQMSKEFSGGNILGLKVGNVIQVIVTSIEGLKEMATKPELDGRPTGLYYTLRTWGLRRGILLVDEEFWKEQRRFLVQHLREFGFGKSNAMETIISREVNSLIDYWKNLIKSNSSSAATTFTLHDAFGVSMLNTIWAMLAGERYELDDIKMRKLQRILHDLMASIDMTGCLFHHFPILRFIAPEFSGYSQYVRTIKDIWIFLQEALIHHQDTFIPGVTRDFMDVYIAELRNKNKGKESSNFSELQLMAICLDLFMAGSDTSSKTLSFGFLHFLRQPEVVKKAQEEMDRVVGRERMPTLSDKSNLPYIEACVCEAIRVFTGQAFGVPHCALDDTTLLGYSIPKGSTVAVNLNGYHMNEQLWEDPWTFKPERFLDEDGKLQIPDYFAPFGLGRRRCIGDTLAKSSLFLFISNILHTFNIRNPEGSPLPDPFPMEGLIPSTQPYEAEISLR